MIKLRGPLQPSTLLLLLAEMMTANNLSAEVDMMIESSISAVEASDIQASSPPNGRLMAQGRALCHTYSVIKANNEQGISSRSAISSSIEVRGMSLPRSNRRLSRPPTPFPAPATRPTRLSG
jgi:hypothetical protein